ncbi:MAG: hypothetical protein JWQ88_826 [Rhodoferax sp.]|nr:hypothetical protein [Rhodoferax sp.]
MKKQIVLFIDGTWNEPSTSAPTHVWTLFRLAHHGGLADGSMQLLYYLPGVGTDIAQSQPGGAGMPSHGHHAAGPTDPAIQRHGEHAPWHRQVLRKPLGGGLGEGTAERIREAYAFLCSQYQAGRGDAVFVFGFSRGAYAVRSLANFVSRIGLLMADHLAHVAEAYRLYESGGDAEDSAFAAFVMPLTGRLLRSGDDPDALRIHFLGVWDTVGAMGLPWRQDKFEARHTEFSLSALPPNTMTARHALALHDLRQRFAPLLWTEGPGHGDLVQMWFAGGHADIGGGHPVADAALGENALRWMIDEAVRSGLRIDAGRLAARQAPPSPDEAPPRLHCGLEGKFRLFPPVVRVVPGRALAGEENSSQALQVHPSLASYLLRPAGQRLQLYRGRRKVMAMLLQVDQTALRLRVWLAARSGTPAVSTPGDMHGTAPARALFDACWAGLCTDDLLRAAVVVQGMQPAPAANGDAVVPPCPMPSKEEAARAIALWTLAAEEHLASRLAREVAATIAAAARRPRQLRDRAHVAAHMALLQHAGAIQDALLASVDLLPPRAAALAVAAVADLSGNLRRQWHEIDLGPLVIGR